MPGSGVQEQMVKRQRLAIYTEGHAKIGMGHIFRTLAIADYLQESFGIAFMLTRSSESAQEVILAQGFDCHVLPVFSDKQQAIMNLKKALADVPAVISDSYEFDTDFQQAIREHRKLACIDDIHAFPFACDLILNHSPHVQTHHYQTLGPPPRFCLGLDFAMLRKEFLQKQEEPVRTGHSLVICMGGTDHKSAGIHILQLVANIQSPLSQVIYVTTSANAHIDRAQALCARLTQENYAVNFAVQCNLSADQMRQLINMSTLMISTPSTIALEGIACRIPLVTLTTADNQRELAEALSQKGATINLGTSDNFSEAFLLDWLHNFMNDDSISQTMKMRQSQLIDLHSKKRIMAEFSKLFGQE
jgi:UDP-2,4-diacetamido-2,4,6-trideoxy-beta-L-altropyranose hydrolase